MNDHLPGMGAIIHDDGVAFRVWAPNATAVSAVGGFNDWNDQAHPMTDEGNGHWYVDVPGATAGQEYKFALTNGDKKLTRVDPYAARMTNSVGNGIIHDHDGFDWGDDDGFVTPDQNNLVIYEMHIGTWAVNHDGRGTLDAAIEHLDHLQRLGVNCVELMPLMEFAGDQSWGYNPAHIFAVESSYGGPDGLKEFVREAHRRGISVLVDVVYNHLGPSDLDLWQFDGWHDDADKGGIYFYNDWRSATPWGDTRPDYGRSEVRNYLRDNALMWMDKYHVQGLRFDMTPYMRSVDATGWDIPDGWSLGRWINDELRARHPKAISIAEDLHGEARVTSSAPDGAAYGAQWDQHFVHPIRQAVITPNDADRSVDEVARAVSYNYGDAFQRVIYTESHDEVANGKARVPQEIDGANPQGWWAKKRSTLGAALALTSPGIPMLFQGQEFLEDQWFRDDDPIDWHLNEAYRGIVLLYRDLIALRLNKGGTTRGLMGQHTKVFHTNQQTGVLAFHRWMEGGAGDDVVVVANLQNTTWGDYRIGFPAAGQWRLVFNSDAKDYSEDFGGAGAVDVTAGEPAQDGCPASAVVNLAPYAVLIYARV